MNNKRDKLINSLQSKQGFTKKTLEGLANNYIKNSDLAKYVEFKNYIEECKKVKNAIKKDKLLIVQEGDKKYDVYIYGTNGPSRLYPIVKKLIGYRLNKNDWTVTIGACGTSRTLEIILHLGYSVGLKFNQISQRQIIL